MNRRLRWIPAKPAGSLGQTAQVVNTNEPAPGPVIEKNQAMMNNLMYGGLILAGLAVVWAVLRGPEPDLTRSWE